jgi:hypothetical protein
MRILPPGVSQLEKANMTGKSVLILAAGEQKRWARHDQLKQLLQAGPETIIDRIVRQVKDRGYQPIIVTHKDELMRDGAVSVIPNPRRWKVESLLSISEFWGKDITLVLLGDVIYQAQVINRIFENSDKTMFFGNYAEIYAFSFTNYDIARTMFNSAWQECVRNGDKGTLHSILRAYVGDFTSTDIEHHKDKKLIFTHVTGDGGWTRDIDAPEDYDLFLEQVIDRGELDDLPRRIH